MSQPRFYIAGHHLTKEQLEAAVRCAHTLSLAYSVGDGESGASIRWEDIDAAAEDAALVFRPPESDPTIWDGTQAPTKTSILLDVLGANVTFTPVKPRIMWGSPTDSEGGHPD